jgi:hypothetical protein
MLWRHRNRYARTNTGVVLASKAQVLDGRGVMALVRAATGVT